MKETVDWLFGKEKMPGNALTWIWGGGGPEDVDVWWRKNFCQELRVRTWLEAFAIVYNRSVEAQLLPHPIPHVWRKNQ